MATGGLAALLFILIKYFFVRRITKWPFGKCLSTTIVLNIATLAIAWLGMMATIDHFDRHVRGIGGPVFWLVLLLIPAVIAMNAAIELFIIKKAGSMGTQQYAPPQNAFKLLVVANLITFFINFVCLIPILGMVP